MFGNKLLSHYNDPFQCKRGGCLAPMNEEMIFPVREAAKRAIDQISQRQKNAS